MTELKPCPFCSAEPEILSDGRRTWGLIQHNDGCLFPTYPKHEIPESDFAAWNTRAERTCERVPGSTPTAADWCATCGAILQPDFDFCPYCGGLISDRFRELPKAKTCETCDWFCYGTWKGNTCDKWEFTQFETPVPDDLIAALTGQPTESQLSEMRDEADRIIGGDA